MSTSHSPIEAKHDASHVSLTSYLIGFGGSLVLTAFSFAAVMSGVIPPSMVLPTITVLAIVQLVVQLFFFMHLGTAPEQRSNTVIFVLTLLLIATIVAGSLWVIHNANVNMMPMQMSPERARAKD
jgi:cytochrome o ubiquinol oxidase subunit IV